MNEYHKIQSIYKRDLNTNKFIEGQWSKPEFEWLSDNKWIFTEKVDGMNIRVMFDGEKISYAGKTDRARLPGDLVERLHELFDDKLDYFKENFIPPEGLQASVCLYGEGYGAGIQNGGCYKNIKGKDFVLFDIKIGNRWLERIFVDYIVTDLGIQIVPIMGRGTIEEAIGMVKNGVVSKWGNFRAEGLVLRPGMALQDSRGNRIITKIKAKDWR